MKCGRQHLYLLALLLAACAQTPEEKINARAGYDYVVLDSFVGDHLSNFSRYISAAEAADIRAGKGAREYVKESWVEGLAVTYKQPGLTVYYWPKPEKVDVWELKLEGMRVPQDLKTRQNWINKFHIKPEKIQGDKVELHGDCDSVTIYFHGDTVQVVDFWYGFGCI